MIQSESDIYSPTVSNEGEYIDFIPTPFSTIKCPCTKICRQFSSRTSFIQHCKTQRHIMWLQNINSEKHNFYKELIKANTIVKQQQVLLTQKENEICHLNLIIKGLKKNIPDPEVDLISF